MRRVAATLAILLAAGLAAGHADAAGKARGARAAAAPWPAGLPVYDHVVIVVEENKDYDQIIGNAAAPYINGVLKAEGASFTRMFGEEHFSQGNYFWLFSGSNQNVGFFDKVPDRLFSRPNLGARLIKRELSFKGYAEGLPEIGSTVDTAGTYARKHVPWASFANLPHGKTAATSSNLRLEDFPAADAFATLPTVAFVIPDLVHDMHDGKIADSIPAGDAWLKDHLDAYYQWAKTHNSLLILTFDENDDQAGYTGLTNPWVEPTGPTDQLRKDLQNRIVTIFAGARIKPGEYPEGPGLTHVNLLRTLEAMYKLPRSGAQQPNAAGGNRNGDRITDNYIVTDVFAPAS